MAKLSVAIGALGSFIRLGRASLGLRRYTEVHRVPNIGRDSAWLTGKAVSVSDGDTFRFYHMPTPFHASTPSGKVSDVAMPIRICTIDAPETSKFGQPSQPYGDEAKLHLEKMIVDQRVEIQILAKDQYQRGVAQVRTGRLFQRCSDEDMLKAGLAEVYLGSGAVYGYRGLEYYLAMQAATQKKGVGIWSDPNRESAADFEARVKKKRTSLTERR